MNQSQGTGPRRWGEGLQPIPETRQAINELEPGDEIEDVLLDLIEHGRHVRELVPDCVGVSLATVERGVTLTLVASDRDIALLDALQYLDAGPCVEAATAPGVVTFERDEVSSDADWESEWRLFAEGTSAAGVRSTLTLPILADGNAIGSVNLYAATPRAFEGLHEQVAAIFQAWAPGAVRNADLSFATREQARQAPRILRDAVRVDAAVGLLVAALGINEWEARRRVYDAAGRAGVTAVQLAKFVLSLLGSTDTPPGNA
jgi:GAF domain-containing protein